MAFNRKAAADYAIAWALKTHPDYPRHGNDCTSFVSQCLLAGGWRMVGERSFFNRQPDDVWWCGGAHFTPWSYTWGGAHNFSKFLATSRRGARLADPKHLDLGDVVQMAESSGHVHHTMIVTRVSGSDRFLSYHTTDTLNKKLTDISLPSGESFLYWKISNTIH